MCLIPDHSGLFALRLCHESDDLDGARFGAGAGGIGADVVSRRLAQDDRFADDAAGYAIASLRRGFSGRRLRYLLYVA